MLVSLVIGLFIFISLVLAFFILVQPSKGDIGSAFLGSQSQMLFGGSGGLGFFQKGTWFLATLFIGGSLVLTVLCMRDLETSRVTSAAQKTIAPKAATGVAEEK